MRNSKGITLVALVITIILMIILATITMNYAIGDGGIIANGQLAKKKTDIARIQESLELEKMNLVSDKIIGENNLDITLIDYIEYIKNRGIITQEDVVDEWNVGYGSCYIKLEGQYYFKIQDDETKSGNFQITYVENLFLVEMQETIQETSISLVITPKEELTKIEQYEYYIKREGEELENKGSNTNGEYTYTGLKHKETYWVEVRAKGENGEEVRLGKWITTLKDQGEPTASITMSGDTLQASFPVIVYAKVEQEDEVSGIKIEECKYIVNNESGEIGLDETKYTGGTFVSEEETLTLELSSIADWYLHILTVDEEDNKTETIQQVTITEQHHSHTGSSSEGGGCYTKSTTHTHTASCNKTCSVSAGYGYYNTGEDIGTCGCGSKHRVYRYIGYRNHSACGLGKETLKTSQAACASYYKEPATTHQYIGCGKSTSTIEYLLNCGKTENTWEGYKVEY